MRRVRRLLHRLASWATSREAEARLKAEIEDHLERQAADFVRAGLSPREARRQAALKFGGAEAVAESWRDQRGLPALETLIQDTRHALRRLRSAPAFTVATVLTLALGIGGTTAIFTLVHAVLLKSLPVSDPGALYRLGKEARCCYWGGYSQDKEFSLVSYELYTLFRDATPGFAEMAAFSAGRPLLGVRRMGTADPAQSRPGEFVSGNYFAMLGLGAVAGRTLAPSDDQVGVPPVAVMSHRLWVERYGGDPSVVGSVFSLDDKPFTVVGVTPRGFFGDTLSSTPPEFFLPLNTEPLVSSDAALPEHATHWLALIGRIRPGASPRAIEARMRLELTRWLRSHWGEMSTNDRAKLPQQTLFLRPGGAGISSMREEYGHWLEILMAVTGCVLLIVCANVAGLTIVRGMEGRRQFALSLALGARPSRVVRERLIESLLLSLCGGAAGLAIAGAGTHAVLQLAFPSAPGVAGVPIDATPSLPVLLFAGVTSLLTGVAFGIAPAWMAARIDPIEALRGTSRVTVRTGSLPRQALIAFQAALSLVVLSAAGLLTQALHGLEHQDFGFIPHGRVIAHIDPRLAAYKPEELAPLFERIHDAVSRVPDVSAVALCLYSPFGDNNWGAGVWIDGHGAPGPDDDIFAFWDRVTAGYFDVIGTPILRGRGIAAEDTSTSRHVAVVNQAFARKFFKSEDPIGRHFGQHGIGSEREYEVIGVARDARYFGFGLENPVGPMFFVPDTQHDASPQLPAKDANPGSHYLHDIVISTRAGGRVSVAKVRQAMASADPGLPIISVRTLEEQVAGQFAQQWLIARLTSCFGVLSLILASVGLYGVTAYDAGRRTNEIGVRMALGAAPADVIRLVLRGALTLMLVGLVVGLPLTFAVGRFLGSQLYGTSPYSPVAVLTAMLALGVSALGATVVPALRASSMSPVDALRPD
jgi:predicted permease